MDDGGAVELGAVVLVLGGALAGGIVVLGPGVVVTGSGSGARGTTTLGAVRGAVRAAEGRSARGAGDGLGSSAGGDEGAIRAALGAGALGAVGELWAAPAMVARTQTINGEITTTPQQTTRISRGVRNGVPGSIVGRSDRTGSKGLVMIV